MKISTDTVDNGRARLITLPRIPDERGNLSIVEELSPLPFRHSRAYWVYDVPGGELRDGHGYRKNREFIVALSGSFEVVTYDKEGKQTFMLNRSYYGLYVPAGTWRQLRNFSTNAVALVLASTPYDETDYFFNYEEASAVGGERRENIIQEPVTETDSCMFADLKPLEQCRIIDYPTHKTRRQGNLSVVENGTDLLPFSLRRSFWIYDVPGGQSRGGHAHAVQHELITAASGSFSVTLSDGRESKHFFLNRPSKGLYIAPGIWIDIHDFSAGAICLAFASDAYEEKDNIRNHTDYLQWRNIL